MNSLKIAVFVIIFSISNHCGLPTTPENADGKKWPEASISYSIR